MEEVGGDVINARGANSLIFKLVSGILIAFMAILGWFLQDIHSDFKNMELLLYETKAEVQVLKKEIEQRNIQDDFYKKEYIDKRFESGMDKIQKNTDRIIDLSGGR